MNQSFYTHEELERKLAEMKIHQRREVLLCVDEMLAFLNTANPAGEQPVHSSRITNPIRPANRI